MSAPPPEPPAAAADGRGGGVPARFTARAPAPEGYVFGPDVFASSIGRRYAAGVLVAAVVDEDGSGATLTFEP